MAAATRTRKLPARLLCLDRPDLGARGRTTDRSEAMARALFPLFTILAFFSALAQSAAADAPAEQANSVTVVIFLVLFIGSCVAFAAYVWWNGRKKGAKQALGSSSGE
jgi:hypothetical protein